MKYIVIHCSDTPNDREVHAAEIHQWHVKQGWRGIGYHKVITRAGAVENGRPEYWKGAHVYNHNEDSLGICLAGRDEFTESQWNALFSLVSYYKFVYPEAKVLGHCDLDKRKTCPNFNVGEWFKSKFPEQEN